MNKKKLIWAVVSVFIAAFTIWSVTSQNKSFSFAHFFGFVLNSNKLWLMGAALCMFGFIWFEGCAIVCIVKSLGYKVSNEKGTVYSAADVYFSAITPSASGGQPASAFFMIKDKIPVSVVTVVLIYNLIMYTLALLGTGIFFMAFRFSVFLKFSTISKILIVVGMFIILFLALMFYLLFKHERILHIICDKCLHVMHKIRIVRNIGKKREKLQQTISNYRQCATCLNGKKDIFVKAFLFNLLQRISQFGVAFMVFMATGVKFADSIKVVAIQGFVSLGSNCVPIPGAMGVADYLMLDGYGQILTSEVATNTELLCRSMSFYGCIIVSALIVLTRLILLRIRSKTRSRIEV